MTASLPQEVLAHLPAGHQTPDGIWFVLPEGDAVRDGISTVNQWLRAEDWYPEALQDVVWYGDDGTGNFFGWRPSQQHAILWNPEDGASPWNDGSVETLWAFVRNGYKDSP